MEGDNQPGQNWSDTQAYTMAVVSLLIGIVAGYLLRTPPTAPAAQNVNSSQGTTQQQTSNPHANVTPEQLKQMGDKTAEPLLAELKNKPNDTTLLTKLGNVYFASGQYEQAAQYLEQSAKIKPQPDVLTRLATTYHYVGVDDKAIETLDRALKTDPKYADALFNLGMLKWRERGDAKGAIAAWETLLKTNPNHPKRAQVEEAIARAKTHVDIPPGTKSDVPLD